MPNKLSDKAFILRFIRYSLSILLLLVLIFASVKVFPFLLPIFFGLILARSAAFFSRQIERIRRSIGPKQLETRHRRRQRIRGVLLYFILNITVLVVFGWLIRVSVDSLRFAAQQVPQVLKADVLVSNMERAFESLSDRLSVLGFHNFNIEKITEYLMILQDRLVANVPKALTYLVNGLTKAVGSLPLASLVILITVMSGYYFLQEGPKFYRMARRLIPDKLFVRRLFLLIETIIDTLFRIVGGYLLIFLITFFEAWIGLSIAQLPHASFWAGIAAFVDMLPVLGIAATLIPIAFYLFLTAATWQGVAVILLLIFMLTARRFIEPLILGGAMRLHPLLTILSMIIGIRLYGLGGVLLGPMILVVLREILKVFELHDRVRDNLKDLFGDPEKIPLRNLNLRKSKRSKSDARSKIQKLWPKRPEKKN